MRIQVVIVSLLMLSFLRLPAAETLVISEFMASNTRTLRDEDNQYSDWIEIRNSGASAVNLDGWYLTDTAGSLARLG